MSNGSPSSTQLNANSKKARPTFHFVAGLFSGISSAVLLQPADLLKTRVQQSGATSLSATLRSILAGPNPISSLWRGTVPSALRTGFGSALYFTSLSSLRQLVANNAAVANSLTGGGPKNGNDPARRSTVLPKLTNTQNLLTGATARVLAGFILMPMTVIKVRYESSFYTYKSIASATSSIFKQEGLRGFFIGFGATAIRDAPYAGLYVVLYEACKTRLNKAFTNEDAAQQSNASIVSGTTINATSGVLAAASATAITNPFDAVKTRLQLMPQKYGNMLKATRLMLKEDGMRSFFDGLGLRMARKAVSSALAWTVYEELIGRAERRFVKEAEKTAAAVI
ncbi:hypothetical protein H2198_007962 [Neophaeococcomyces mojaviensis]|uniref:Uncharacterized protein n=1 Tax=Neophaeococcomyces mojaviensis TaxID=3383035 RepID=A0ACC2ZYM1_9EURO|nr:hypothetical protein H2198_007962 [Knufia sp. JES_112]